MGMGESLNHSTFEASKGILGIINDNDTTLNVSAISYKDQILNRFTQKVGVMQSILNSKSRATLQKESEKTIEPETTNEQSTRKPTEADMTETTEHKMSFTKILNDSQRRLKI